MTPFTIALVASAHACVLAGGYGLRSQTNPQRIPQRYQQPMTLHLPHTPLGATSPHAMQLQTTHHSTNGINTHKSTAPLQSTGVTQHRPRFCTCTTMRLPLLPTFTRTTVCSGFVGPSDPHPKPTFGTSHRRMTGRDTGGPEDEVPLRPPDFGLTPPPE